MSRKVAGAIALLAVCGISLLGLLPKAPAVGRQAGRAARPSAALARPGVADAALEARLRGALRTAPLQFEANLGQTDERVKFMARGTGYALFLTPEEAVVTLHRPYSREKKPIYLQEQELARGWHSEEPLRAAVRMKFLGASGATKLTGVDGQATHTNYVLGKDPSRWRRNVPSYRQVRYENLYPGVDAVFYGEHGELEYDFIVKPGVDPRVITLGFEGARKLELSGAGEVVAETGAGEVRMLQPRVYQQTAGGAQVPVAGRYVQRSATRIGFELATYDRGRTLVIDPQVTPTGSALQLGTYFGGDFDDAITSIAVGNNGQVYVAGYTDSQTLFPAAGTPFQGTNAGSFDCTMFPQHPCGDGFVATLNTTTGALVAVTYLGGTGDDVIWGLALDGTNNPYVVGETTSADFPLSLAPNPLPFQGAIGSAACGGGTKPRPCRHAFYSKLSSNLSTLLYSTYLAGTDDDEAFAVAVGSSGTAFITGVAGANFPLSASPFQATYHGGGDAFVAEIDPTMSAAASLIYSTYLGGTGTDSGLAIAVNANHDAFVGGATFSTVSTTVLFPTTATALQGISADTSACGPGGFFNCGDGFFAEIDPAGATLLYSSFFGGDSSDQINGIALDGSGNVYLTGTTISHATPIPTTTGAFNTAGSTGFDAFAAKVNSSVAGAAGLVYSTFLAGSSDDSGNAITVDTLGNAFISGTTNSSNYPTNLAMQSVSRSFQQTSFVTSVNTTGTGLNFSTYYGGSNTETGRAIALDTSGLVYAGGSTLSDDICIANAFQNKNNSPFSFSEGFLTIINPTNVASACVQLPTLFNTPVPGPLNLGAFLVGTASFAQTVNLLNAGSARMTFSTAMSGANPADFKETDTCAGLVAPGSVPCVLSITFTPSVGGGGMESATMTITTSGLVSSTMVNLTGVGLSVPPITLTPNPVTFLPEVPGTTEAPLTVTLANTGGAATHGTLTVTNIALSGTNPGDFTIQPVLTGTFPSCFFSSTLSFPINVSPGFTCLFNVTFTPSAQNPSPRTATLTATSNGTPAMQSITINGPTAAGNGPNISFQGPLSFGPVQQGTTSAPQTLTFTNTGGAPMTVSMVTPSANFAVPTNTCGAALPPAPAAGSTCSVTVTFTPPGTGPFAGTLTIVDTAPGSPHMMTLSGTGTPPNSPGITTSSAVNFGQQVLNTTSGGQTVTITSSGTAALSFTSIVAGGDYASADNCPKAPATLAVGTSCMATVTFTPTGLGARIGALTVTDSAPGSPHMIGLTGTGINNGGPGISLSGPLSFGPVLQSTTSPAQTVTLSNNGVAALTITSIVAAGDYAQANNCPASLPISTSCTIMVTFTPTAVGTRNGTVTITDNAAGSPHIIPLTGVGTTPAGGPIVSLNSALFFGPVGLMTPSAPQNVTVVNTGGAPLTFTSIAAGGDYSETNNCGAVLGIGANCSIMVTFTPTVLGVRNGTLTITDNAPTSPQVVSLSGSGVTFSIAAQTGHGTAASVSPGDTAQYDLAVVPNGGFIGTVNLSCTGNPATTICTPSATSVTLNGTSNVNVMVTVQTNCVTGSTPPRPRGLPPAMPKPLLWMWLATLLAILMLRWLAPAAFGGRVARLIPVLALLLVMVTWAGCAASVNPDPPGVPSGPTTPGGIYNIQVIGTSGTGAAAQTNMLPLVLRVL